MWSNWLFLRGAIDDPLAGASDLTFVAIAYENLPGKLGGVLKVALESEAAPGLTRSRPPRSPSYR